MTDCPPTYKNPQLESFGEQKYVTQELGLQIVPQIKLGDIAVVGIKSMLKYAIIFMEEIP